MKATITLIKTTFGELQIGENFRRADGVNGGSYDKVSAKRAKPCCLDNNMKPVEFAADFPCHVLRRDGKEAILA